MDRSYDHKYDDETTKDYFVANHCWSVTKWHVTCFNINIESKSIPHMGINKTHSLYLSPNEEKLLLYLFVLL